MVRPIDANVALQEIAELISEEMQGKNNETIIKILNGIMVFISNQPVIELNKLEE